MRRYPSPLSVVIKGALSGLVGTAVLTEAMKRAPVLMQQLGLAPSDASMPRTTEHAEQQAGQPTEKLAEKVAVGVLDRPIEENSKQVAGQLVHWGYGTAWGVLYGIVQGSFRWPDLVHGTLFGTLVATVASTLVPAMGLTPPPARQPVVRKAMQIGFHLVYGWTTALTFRLLSRGD